MIGVLAMFSVVFGLVACNVNEDNHNQNINNDDMDISASQTSLSSNQYPHTKAILVQDAKYKFVQIDPKEAADLQAKIQEELNKQLDQYKQIPKQGQQAQQAKPVPKQGQQAQQAKPVPKQGQQAQQPKPVPKQEQQAPAQEQKKAEAPKGISQYAQQVIDLTNKERANAGLPALKADAALSNVAQKKSEDMQKNNYFSHTSPTYGSPFDMMRDFGISYKTAGENIAQGQRTPQEVVNAWMNSPGHRKNILSQQFTHIGVGYESGGNHWTQMFIGR